MNYEYRGKQDVERHKINQEHNHNYQQPGDKSRKIDNQFAQNLKSSTARSNRQIADYIPTDGYRNKNRSQMPYLHSGSSYGHPVDKSLQDSGVERSTDNEQSNQDSSNQELSRICFPLSERLRSWVQYYRWHDTGHKKHPLIFQQKYGDQINAIVLEMETNGQKIRGQQILDHCDKVILLCDEIDTLCRFGCSNAQEEKHLEHLCETIKSTVFRLADLIDGYCLLPQNPELSKLQQGRMLSEIQRTPPIKIVEMPPATPSTASPKPPIEALTKTDRDILQAMSAKPKSNMFKVDIEAAAGYGKDAVANSLKRLNDGGYVCRPAGAGRKGWALTEKGETLTKSL